MNTRLIRNLLAAAAFGASGLVQASAVPGLLDEYRAGGVADFSAERGGQLWTRSFAGQEGDSRACTTCHGEDLRMVGKHARTGKRIEPMAPSVNADRLTDVAKINKWFKRNCKWTLGRECTPQEKGDLLLYIERR